MTRVPAPAARVTTGPFQTEDQAHAVPGVRYACRTPAQVDIACHRMLCQAITAAGVTLGGYDHEVVLFLARGAPEHCAVIAGLITRASESEGI